MAIPEEAEKFRAVRRRAANRWRANKMVTPEGREKVLSMERKLAERRRKSGKTKIYNRQWQKRALKENKTFRLSCFLRTRINGFAKGKKDRSTETLIGCSFHQFREYISSLFTEGMSWNNWGRGDGNWHLDHKRPCASFDLSNPEQLAECFHYSNYQPLWSRDNKIKSSKWNGKLHRFKT